MVLRHGSSRSSYDSAKRLLARLAVNAGMKPSRFLLTLEFMKDINQLKNKRNEASCSCMPTLPFLPKNLLEHLLLFRDSGPDSKHDT
jgi:hypothetical protein